MKSVHVSPHRRRVSSLDSLGRHLRREKEPALFRSEVRLAKGETVEEAARDLGERTLILKSGGVKAVVKSQGGRLEIGGNYIVTRQALRESVVDTLDDLFEFGVVPPTILMEVRKGQAASVQQFVEDSVSFEPLNEEQKSRIDKSDLVKMYLLDMIVGQTDRHGTNILVTGDLMPGRGLLHAHAIDNGSSLTEARFVGDQIWGGHISIFGGGFRLIRGMKIPDSIRRKLRGVAYEDFLAATAGIESAAVAKAWNRKLQVENWTHIKSGLEEQ